MHAFVEIKNYVNGRYHFAKGRADELGEPVPGTHVELGEFHNLITNQGMDYIYDTIGHGTLSTKEMFPYCFVGTGNTTPAFTDTQLATYLAGSNSATGNSVVFVDDATHPYWKYTNTYRFNAGVATGNIAEVGVGRANTELSSRALILDGGGLPTTITILSDEYLDVTFEWRNYINPADGTGTATISGTAYAITYRPSDIDTAPSIYYPVATPPSGIGLMRVRETDVLGTVYTAPSGTAGSDLSLAIAAYTAGTWYADITGDWGLSVGNFTTGIGSLEFQCSQGRYQVSFTPKIPKTAAKILTLTLRISWARYP